MIYKAKRVYPMEGRIVENGEVLVDGCRIGAVGEGLSASHPNQPVTDLGTCALLPGFVNAHSHIDYTLRRNLVDALNFWDWIERVGFNKNRSPAYGELLGSARVGARELVRSGVTCLADSTYSGAAAEAMAELGLRGIAYKEIFGQSMGEDYGPRFAAALDEVAKLREKMPERIKIGISPHAIYTSNRELLELCAKACRELGMPIAIHLAEVAAEVRYSLDGTGPMADLRRRSGYEPMVNGTTPGRYLADVGLLQPGVSLAHCVCVDGEEIGLIARSGASVAHCPRSNAYLGSGVAPIPAMMNAGAPVGLGTDSAGSCMRFDFFEEMRFVLAMHRAAAQDATVITAKQVLEMATVGGARALGLDGEVGTLGVGKRADMIAVDMSATHPDEEPYLAILSRSPEDVRLAMVDGIELRLGSGDRD